MFVPKDEDHCVLVARIDLSQTDWKIGELAYIWEQRFARGRSVVDFGALIGVGKAEIEQRLRVYKMFFGLREVYPALHWSHFAAAAGWDDFSVCLKWAQDMDATVAEMKAWRRAQNGEPLEDK